jgi:hypothetical protein
MTDGARKLIAAISLFGIIFLSLLPFDPEATGWVSSQPGLRALIICIASAAFIFTAVPNAVFENPIGRFMDRIGSYSYSIYLVHFPVIAFGLYRPFEGTPSGAGSIGAFVALILCVFLASLIMYHYVELPFRSGSGGGYLVGSAFSCIALMAMFGENIKEDIIDEPRLKIFQALLDRAEYRCGIAARVLHPFAFSCELTGNISRSNGSILLVGNSHADAIKTTFSAAAIDHQVSVWFIVPNNPLMPGGATPERIIEEAKIRVAKTIVLHYSPDAIGASVVRRLAMLAYGNGIKVGVILPVPVWRHHVPKSLIAKINDGEALEWQDDEGYNEQNKDLIENVKELTPANVAIYRTDDIFCKPQCVMIDNDGYPIYSDNNHLTLHGSSMLKSRFEEAVAYHLVD